MQLKQYSCYCGMCSEKRYSECPHLATTRSRKHEPKKAGLARTRWVETGWVEYSMKLKEDTEARELREITSKQRLDFVKGLKVGDVIGVYCGGQGMSTTPFSGLRKCRQRAEQMPQLETARCSSKQLCVTRAGTLKHRSTS